MDKYSQNMRHQSVSTRRAIIAIVLVMLGLFAVSVARATDIEVDSFHLGGFYDLDAAGMPLIPDNDMSFQNYFMGHTTVGGFTTTERRTFFAFDLTSVVIPDGEIITGVSFDLTLPFAGILANFTDGVEEVLFTSTTTDYLGFADPLGSGMGPDEIFDSMGTGDFYGGLGFDEMTPDGEFSVEMSMAALGDMEASLVSGDPFMITALLDTYDPAAGSLFEFVFGLTDVVVGDMPTGLSVPKLIITTAPVPSPSGVLVLAGGALLGTRRRR